MFVFDLLLVTFDYLVNYRLKGLIYYPSITICRPPIRLLDNSFVTICMGGQETLADEVAQLHLHIFLSTCTTNVMHALKSINVKS